VTNAHFGFPIPAITAMSRDYGDFLGRSTVAS
jgi:hypothetical protein